MDYDTFNVGRREDRNRLANAVWDRISKDDRPSKNVYASYLGEFCEAFFARYNALLGAEESADVPEMGPPPFLLAPYILEGAGTMIFGDPGLGKSNLALLMAQSLNRGCGAFWQISKQTKVLYVNLERSKQSIARRRVLVNERLELELDSPLLVLNARGRRLADAVDQIELAIEQHHVEVVFVDSLSRAGMGSLTEDEPANRIMDALNSSCPTWVLLAHPPRGDKTHAFGSMMFDAAADLIIQVLGQRKQDGTLGLGLQVTKANDTPFPEMQVWAMEFDTYGLSCFRAARRGEFAEIEAGKHTSMADQVYSHLLAIGQADATSIGGELGFNRSNVANLLTADERFVRSGRDGKRALYAVKAEAP